MADDGSIPKGRMRRAVPLAALTARTIGGRANHWVRLRRAGEDEKLAKELEFHARQAQRYADPRPALRCSIPPNWREAMSDKSDGE